MAIEYKLPYTGEEVGRRLAQVDVLAQDIVDLGEAVEEQLTGLSDGFTAVIQQMYGEDFPENEGDPVTIREIAEAAAPTKVSELTNDSGFITGYTETDPTVPAWAKASTKPSYTKSEVGLGNVDNVKQYSANNPPPYPVTKVNNKTGAVTLSASDVGADASGTASSAVSAHNTNTSAHNDMRLELQRLAAIIVDLLDSDDETLNEMHEIVAYIKSNKELIDGITTSKVSISDIVNNLTSNVTNKPLSAAQGVALKALIDAITVPTKVSQLTNDAKYLTSFTETDPTVPAWAKASSKPSYSKSEVGLGNVDNVKQYSASNPPPYPVRSVNGQTGVVTISVPSKVSELDNDSKFLTAVPSEYVTDTELTNKGYAVKSSAETWTFKLKDGSTVTKKVVLA